MALIVACCLLIVDFINYDSIENILMIVHRLSHITATWNPGTR